MNRLTCLVLLAVSGLSLCSAAWAQETRPATQPETRAQARPDGLVRELEGAAPAKERTPEQLQAAYEQAVDSLLERITSPTVKPQRESLERMAIHAGRPGAEAQRATLSKVLASRLGEGVNVEARVWAMKQLETIGGAEAVEGLAKALKDGEPRIRESARRALATNPSAEASAALREAVKAEADPAWQLALIQAMGYRNDPADAAALIALADSENDDIRTTAIQAAAQLGDASAEPAIVKAQTRGTPAARQAATDAYLLLADRLAAKGEKSAAVKIYRKLMEGPRQVQCAAIIGLSRAGGPAELDALFAAMDSSDAQVRGAAVEGINNLQGPQVTAALAAKVPTASAAMKPALLQALALRRDSSTLPVFVAAAADSDPAVRTLAIQAIGELGNTANVPLLLKAAADESTQPAARSSLAVLKGDDVNAALLSAAKQGEAAQRIEAINALSERQAVEAIPAILQLTSDPAEELRRAAFEAMASVGDEKSLPGSVDRLVKADNEDDRTLAANAVVEIALRIKDADARTAPLLAALATANKPAKLALLPAIGRLGGLKAYQAVKAVLADTDEEVYEAAVRALCDWVDTQPADDLAALAVDARTPTLKIVAQRGYIRLAGLAESNEKKLAMLTKAFELAKRPEERKLVLGGLGAIPSLEALKLVEPYINNPDVAEEACAAAVSIASSRSLPQEDRAAVRPAMEKVVAVTKVEATRTSANTVLNPPRGGRRQPVAPPPDQD